MYIRSVLCQNLFSHGYPCNDFAGEIPLANYRETSWDLGGIIYNGRCLSCQRSFWLLYDIALYNVLSFEVLLYFALNKISLYNVLPFEVLLYFALNKISTGCNWMILFVCSSLHLYIMVYFKVLPDDNLTHWGWATHICISKLTIIGSDNGLSPGRRQAMLEYCQLDPWEPTSVKF